MIRLAIITCALSACALGSAQQRGEACFSPCGAMLSGSTDCAGFIEQESRAVAELSPLYAAETPPVDVCFALRGWHVQMLPTGDTASWIDYWGRRVSGLTYCDGRQVVQIAADQPWRETALSHEIAHVAECGQPFASHEHDTWTARGVYAAIDRADAP